MKKFKERVKDYNEMKRKKKMPTLKRTEKMLETFKRITAWEIVDAMIQDIIQPIGVSMGDFLTTNYDKTKMDGIEFYKKARNDSKQWKKMR